MDIICQSVPAADQVLSVPFSRREVSPVSLGGSITGISVKWFR